MKIWGTKIDLMPPFLDIFMRLDLLHVEIPNINDEWVAHIPLTPDLLSIHGPTLIRQLASSIECNQRSLPVSYVQWFAQYSMAIILGVHAASTCDALTSKAWLDNFELLLLKFPKEL